MSVYKAINGVQADLAKKGISKDQTNQFDKYKFRSIDAIQNAIAPLFVEHQLVMMPRVVSREQVERVSQKGGALFYTTVTVEYDFISVEDGSKHTVIVVGEAMDRGDKSTNKAMTAAYKYALFQTFCIPTEGQPDAESETHEVKIDTRRKNPHPGRVAPTTEQPKEQDLSKARHWLETAAASSMAELEAQWKSLDAETRIALGSEYIQGLKKRAAQSDFYSDNREEA